MFSRGAVGPSGGCVSGLLLAALCREDRPYGRDSRGDDLQQIPLEADAAAVVIGNYPEHGGVHGEMGSIEVHHAVGIVRPFYGLDGAVVLHVVHSQIVDVLVVCQFMGDADKDGFAEFNGLLDPVDECGNIGRHGSVGYRGRDVYLIDLDRHPVLGEPAEGVGVQNGCSGHGADRNRTVLGLYGIDEVLGHLYLVPLGEVQHDGGVAHGGKFNLLHK